MLPFFKFWLFFILVELLVPFQEQMFNVIPNVPIMISQSIPNPHWFKTKFDLTYNITNNLR
jgi:hypothetical protein